ncbi:uncharacterized protein ELE39_001505 [Cryptosporidium sp. chipmunk genotype I]|uniref:uncharacterized protein n=1 Tax=Cryptosporidium sp. chipmunk genotype I TaxID=1280935 RepID=UPI00351A322A|nr:hypothetical protein ELE39_001505 [Cryptosporidium sp. chipmunk genotype I]
MKEREGSNISEKEKINSWLEKQILIWNGTPINQLSGKNRVSQLSSNIKVKSNDNGITEKYQGIKNLKLNEKKENIKQTISDNVSNKMENNEKNRNSNVRLKFKDWSDLHNYLLVSMRQE